jgi:hypothetical protein
MDMTIRRIDAAVYRALKARAALTGKTIGETLNEAIKHYLASPPPLPKSASLRELVPEAYPRGNERLSEKIDAIVYGT